MADTVKHYDAGWDGFRTLWTTANKWYRRSNETQEDRRKKLESLFVVIRGIERERDADLLVELTPDQLASWRKMQGKPFAIVWPPTSVSDSPCEESK